MTEVSNNREMYWVTVKYDHPVAGTVQLFAQSEEQAKDILTRAHGNMRGFEIIDCYRLSEDQVKAVTPEPGEMQQEFDFQDDVINKDKLN